MVFSLLFSGVYLLDRELGVWCVKRVELNTTGSLTKMRKEKK